MSAGAIFPLNPFHFPLFSVHHFVYLNIAIRKVNVTMLAKVLMSVTAEVNCASLPNSAASAFAITAVGTAHCKIATGYATPV